MTNSDFPYTKVDSEPTKLKTVGMYWTVKDNKHLILGNSCKDLMFNLPDFIVVKSYPALNNNPTIKVVCTIAGDPINTEPVELELELQKGVPPDYVEAGGNIIINDVADKQLIDSLRHSSGPERCGICEIKVPNGLLINYCCQECYANIRKSLKYKGFVNAKALSGSGIDFIRNLQGDPKKVCHICGNEDTEKTSDVCQACASFISAGHPTQ